MRRLMTAATTWVTAKQEMQGTVESLICIILEGVFETNCGNLRRAWVVLSQSNDSRSPIPSPKTHRPRD